MEFVEFGYQRRDNGEIKIYLENYDRDYARYFTAFNISMNFRGIQILGYDADICNKNWDFPCDYCCYNN